MARLEFDTDEPDDMVGESMECYRCPGAAPDAPILRPCVKRGAVVNQRADPTQTYVLDCGHVVI